MAIKIPGFFTIDQAARYVGLKVGTVRRYCHRKTIRAEKLGPVYVIKKADLDLYLKTRRGPGNPNFRKN